MKQRIDIEQLMELTEGQRQNLMIWWNPNPGDCAILETYKGQEIGIINTVDIKQGTIYINWDNTYGFLKEHLLPLLNIWQMIELLDNQDKDHNLYIANNPGTSTWEIHRIYTKDGKANTTDIEKSEFCDCLWQAVKEIL
jgi:hypothetical protein